VRIDTASQKTSAMLLHNLANGISFTAMPINQTVHHLTRPEGRIAYTDTGSGPLVVAVPGMGDVRSTYDELVPLLTDAGYRVVVTDLRGHGDSDTSFTVHGDEATASDVVALVEHLDAGPAVLLGVSMGASSAVVAAAERPELVRGLVLITPFLRDPLTGAKAGLMRVAYRVLFARPWGVAFWSWYYSSVSRGRRSDRHAEHVAEVARALRAPGHLSSLRRLALSLDHSVVERRLPAVQAPALVLVGARDSDFPDPATEFPWIQERLDARCVLVPESGHYSQHQAPDVVAAEALGFMSALPASERKHA